MQSIAESDSIASIILSSMTDAIITLDSDLHIINVNNSLTKLAGFDLSQIIGRPVNEVIRFFDRDREIRLEEYCPVDKNNDEGVIFSKKDLKMMILNKKDLYVNLSTSQLKHDTKFNVRAILTIHDITFEREQEQLRLDFLSVVAHELRTPMTSILGYLDVFI